MEFMLEPKLAYHVWKVCGDEVGRLVCSRPITDAIATVIGEEVANVAVRHGIKPAHVRLLAWQMLNNRLVAEAA